MPQYGRLSTGSWGGSRPRGYNRRGSSGGGSTYGGGTMGAGTLGQSMGSSGTGSRGPSAAYSRSSGSGMLPIGQNPSFSQKVGLTGYKQSPGPPGPNQQGYRDPSGQWWVKPKPMGGTDPPPPPMPTNTTGNATPVPSPPGGGAPGGAPGTGATTTCTKCGGSGKISAAAAGAGAGAVGVNTPANPAATAFPGSGNPPAVNTEQQYRPRPGGTVGGPIGR